MLKYLCTVSFKQYNQYLNFFSLENKNIVHINTKSYETVKDKIIKYIYGDVKNMFMMVLGVTLLAVVLIKSCLAGSTC